MQSCWPPGAAVTMGQAVSCFVTTSWRWGRFFVNEVNSDEFEDLALC